MAKPGEKELETALKMAAQMRDKDIDPFFIAKTLLNYHYRMKYLEDIMTAADRYLNHGMAEQARSQLLRAIEQAKDIDAYTSSSRRESFGLE